MYFILNTVINLFQNTDGLFRRPSHSVSFVRGVDVSNFVYQHFMTTLFDVVESGVCPADMQPITLFAINEKTLFVAFTAARIRIVFELQEILTTDTICFLVS